MLINIENEQVYPLHDELINVLCAARNGTAGDSLVAVNMGIVLASSCYLEGFLEALAKSIVDKHQMIRSSVDIEDFYTRKRINIFYGHLEEKINRGLKTKTSIKALMEHISDLLCENPAKDETVEKLSEGITVLGHLRNLIAHGRAIVIEDEVDSEGNVQRARYHSVAYDKALSYFTKTNLIKDIVSNNYAATLFTNDVADWACNIAHQYAEAVQLFADEIMRPKSDEEEIEELFSDITAQYNAEYGTNYSFSELLRKGLVTITFSEA